MLERPIIFIVHSIGGLVVKKVRGLRLFFDSVLTSITSGLHSRPK